MFTNVANNGKTSTAQLNISLGRVFFEYEDCFKVNQTAGSRSVNIISGWKVFKIWVRYGWDMGDILMMLGKYGGKIYIGTGKILVSNG